MESVSFVSAKMKEMSKEELKAHRKRLMEDAMKEAKKSIARKEKEGAWMLPDLDSNMFGEEKSKKRKKSSKEKKHKKEKKSKKEKRSKKKKRRRDSSSSSSSSASEDEWVEKPKDSSEKQRDSWMQMGSEFEQFGSSKRGESKRASKKEEERAKLDESRNKILAERELNPTLREEYKQKSSSQGTSSSLSMLKRAVERVYEQAEFEGKSIEEVATHRWGSFQKFKDMEKKVNAAQDNESQTRQREEEDSPKRIDRVASKKGWKTEARRQDERVIQTKPKAQEKEPEPEKPSNLNAKESVKQEETKTLMSEEEMNKLGAKIVKAELLGNHDKAKELRCKLEEARQAKKDFDQEQARGQGSSKAVEEVVVVLSKTDSKGFTRPIEPTNMSRAEAKKSKGKVQTHSDGNRVRYFADDDRYDLKEMFHREKMSTAEDQNSMMSRLAGKAVEKTDDDDYSIDDLFVSRAARKRSEEQDKVKERDAAIAEHRSLSRTLDSCPYCFDGSEFKKHLLGNYLELATFSSVVI